MIRLVWLIIFLAATGAVLVHIRAQQNDLKAQMCRLESRRVELRRQIWQQQIRQAELSNPQYLKAHGQWALEMTGPLDMVPTERKITKTAAKASGSDSGGF